MALKSIVQRNVGDFRRFVVTSPFRSLPAFRSFNTPRLQLYSFNTSPPSLSPISNSRFSTSSSSSSLMDFFDDSDNWGKKELRVGRAWNIEELRLKSNSDLHQLWFVLLKEVNLLLTMEEEYRRLCVSFPSPDRLDKCDESMENILAVVAERDEAFHLLETGIPGRPRREWRHDQLGRPFVREFEEHLVPESHNDDHEPNPFDYPKDNEQWIWRGREADLSDRRYAERLHLARARKLKQVWPENKVLRRVPDPNPRKEDFT